MEFVIGFIILVCFVGIYNFFSETYKSIREKEQQEFEHKKKVDQQALDAQRKKYELDLELRKQAGLNPIFQEQQRHLELSQRKNMYYKISLLGIPILIALIWYGWSKEDGETTRDPRNENHILTNINKSSQEEKPLESVKNFETAPKQTSEQNNQVDVSPRIKQSVVSDQSTVAENAIEAEIGHHDIQEETSQISIHDAQMHIGENADVCGVVSQIYSAKKATYINFGGQYPHQAFSAVIWKSSSDQNLYSLESQSICVTGLIASYKGTPQISVNNFQTQIVLN